MTVKEKQSLLYFLGYYGGEIDGIWGTGSQAAEQAFRSRHGELTEDTREKILAAISGKDSDWWADIQYFRPAEFACKCGSFCDGYPAQMAESVVRAADRVRRHFGAAGIVSSGLRCAKHNANVGGVSNSRHLTGKAVDFCIAGKSAAEVLAYVQQQPEIRYAYAIDGQFVHMDVVD